MCIFSVREPICRVVCFRLANQSLSSTCSRDVYLSHSSKHLIATPFWESPVVIVLLHPSHTNCAIATTASTKKSTSGNVDCSTVQARNWRRDKIPIGLSFMVLSPPASNQTCCLSPKGRTHTLLPCAYCPSQHYLAQPRARGSSHASLLIIDQQ